MSIVWKRSTKGQSIVHWLIHSEKSAETAQCDPNVIKRSHNPSSFANDSGVEEVLKGRISYIHRRRLLGFTCHLFHCAGQYYATINCV